MIPTAASALLLPLALLTACAGKASIADQAAVSGPPVDAGHGSVDEVVAALAQQGVPCVGPRRLRPLPGTEEALECLLGPSREKVLIVHFVGPSDARAFYEVEQDAGRHGAYALTWAARTVTEDAAALFARAVASRTYT